MSESFSNLCVEKRWDFLWYNNDNLKSVDLWNIGSFQNLTHCKFVLFSENYRKDLEGENIP